MYWKQRLFYPIPMSKTALHAGAGCYVDIARYYSNVISWEEVEMQWAAVQQMLRQ